MNPFRKPSRFTRGWHFAIAIAALALPLSAADTPKRPNLVIFISDDHTAHDSSVYGSKDVKTPNMERLAAAGLTFNRAYAASPTCAPSRAAMLTGRMPARNGSEANHSKPLDEIKKMPAYLKEQGYEVIAFGKVAHYEQTNNYGFDLALHNKFHEDVAIPEALKWLEARNGDKPLALFVGTNWPHVPWPAKADAIDAKSIIIPPNHVATPVTRQARAKYYAAINNMDRELGEVYDKAKEKFGDNLFFLHFADQGAQWPFGKWTMYEDGIHTPMIAVWPGHIAAGKRTDAMVSQVDVLPTLVEIAGGKAPEDIDGKSMIPVLEGKSDTFRDKIYATHSGDGNFNVYPSRCINDGKFKYILNLHPEFKFTSHVTKAGEEGAAYWKSWVEKAANDPVAADKVKRYSERPKEELYDLTADPLEAHDLHDDPAQADRLAAMRKDLEGWMDKQGDKKTVFGQPTMLDAK